MSARPPGRARLRQPALLVGALLVGASCHRADVPLPELTASTVGDTTGLVARGEYVVRTVAVCGGCHAADPRNPDGPLSGGMEFRDWRIGTARAANLTSDVETGIGAWSEAEIVRALRNGEHRSGRLLAPVMPYEWFNGMSDRDAMAVARYLRSLPAVRHEVKESPNFAFKAATALFLGPREGASRIAPTRASAIEYGRYLSQSVALCADCHTPRYGLQQKPDYSRLFAGTNKPPKGFPENPANITPDSATGIGRWSEADFVRTIRTGVNPAGDTLHPFMPWHQLRRMADEDLHAVYRYLRTVPPIRNEVTVRSRSG